MELGCSLVGIRLVVSNPVSYWEYVILTNLPAICQFSLYFVINFSFILLVYTFCKIWKFWILWDMNSSILEYTSVAFFSQTDQTSLLSQFTE